MGKANESTEREHRRYRVEFKVEIAERMLAGENVTSLSQQHSLPRSMMYRWRDAFRERGAVGLQRSAGRPPGSSAGSPRPGGSPEEKLRRRIAKLEQKVGRQALENDFLGRVFKQVSELPKARGRGDNASTSKSDG